MKVLVADGSQVVTKRLLSMMQEITHVESLTPAYDAQATLDSMRANDPALLIVDIHIPGAKEMNLLSTIRRENPKVILIVLTNLVYPQYQKQAKRLGADMFMDKSKEFVRLSQLVRELACSSFDENIAGSPFVCAPARYPASGLSTRAGQGRSVQTTLISKSFGRI